MARLHNHFELSGWHESKKIAIFSIATVIRCLIGLMTVTLEQVIVY